MEYERSLAIRHCVADDWTREDVAMTILEASIMTSTAITLPPIIMFMLTIWYFY